MTKAIERQREEGLWRKGTWKRRGTKKDNLNFLKKNENGKNEQELEKSERKELEHKKKEDLEWKKREECDFKQSLPSMGC